MTSRLIIKRTESTFKFLPSPSFGQHCIIKICYTVICVSHPHQISSGPNNLSVDGHAPVSHSIIYTLEAVQLHVLYYIVEYFYCYNVSVDNLDCACEFHYNNNCNNLLLICSLTEGRIHTAYYRMPYSASHHTIILSYNTNVYNITIDFLICTINSASPGIMTTT